MNTHPLDVEMERAVAELAEHQLPFDEAESYPRGELQAHRAGYYKGICRALRVMQLCRQIADRRPRQARVARLRKAG